MSIGRRELRNYYNQRYAGQEHSSRSWESYLVFLEYLDVGGGYLLDVSCGNGYLLKAAEERGLMTFGIDFSEVAIEQASKLAKNSHLCTANSEALPYKDASFDYITNLGSLEHYLNIDIALQEMVRVSKTAAKLCIMVPNSHYLFDLIHVLRTGHSMAGTGQIVEKLATIGEWKHLLHRNGLEVIKVYRDKEPRVTSWRNVFSDANPRHILFKMGEKLLQAYMPLNLGYQFVFICQKQGRNETLCE